MNFRRSLKDSINLILGWREDRRTLGSMSPLPGDTGETGVVPGERGSDRYDWRGWTSGKMDEESYVVKRTGEQVSSVGDGDGKRVV